MSKVDVPRATAEDSGWLVFFGLGWMVALAFASLGSLHLAFVASAVAGVVLLVDRLVGIETRYVWSGRLMRGAAWLIVIVAALRLGDAWVATSLGARLWQPAGIMLSAATLGFGFLTVIVITVARRSSGNQGLVIREDSDHRE